MITAAIEARSRRPKKWAAADVRAGPSPARRSRRLGSRPSKTGVLVVHVHAGADLKPETALAAGQRKPLRKFTRQRVHRSYDRNMLGWGEADPALRMVISVRLRCVDNPSLRAAGSDQP